MTDNIKLPPMPETEWNLHMPAQYYEHAWKSTESGYTEADMENYAREAVRLNAQADQTDARDAARWRYIAWHIGVAWNEQGFTSLVRIVSDKHRAMLGDMVDRMMAGDWPEAAPQPAQLLDDESDALTIAYLHGHGKGKDSVQPFLAEKDALLRQALEALEGFTNITNDSQGVAGYHLSGDTAEWDEFDEVDAASNTIKAIRNHLGVEP